MRYRGEAVTIAAIVIFGGLIAYAIIRDSGDGDAVAPSPGQPSGTVQATGVGFNSPRDGDTVSNPVQVALVVAGLVLQKAGEPVTPGFGHFGVVIDEDVPPDGAQFVSGATHLDLTDASHNATLPNLTPGAHTLSVVFLNANSISHGPLLSETIHITVSP